MAVVKSVKLDGEVVHIFNSAIYFFESSSAVTLELDIIISEVVLRKYKNIDNVIAEIELEDGRMINSIMHIKVLTGRIPRINLYCEPEDPDEYKDFDRLNEFDSQFPNIEDGITIEKIREVEMPDEKITIKVTLPIDQVEWLKEQKHTELSRMLNEMIKDYWKNHGLKNQ